MRKYFAPVSVQERTRLVQQLFRLLDASQSLSQKVSACAQRLTVLQAPLDHEDVAGVTDRINEIFTRFAALTKGTGWHDIEDDKG